MPNSPFNFQSNNPFNLPSNNPFDFLTLGQNASLPGDEFNSATDFAQLLGPLGERQYRQYGPIQENVLDILQKVLQGDVTAVEKGFAPTGAAIRAQLGHAYRNAQDNTPLSQIGDTMAKLGQNAMTTTAGAFSQFLDPFIKQAMGLGQNAVMSQVVPILASAGQIAKKPASGGGGISP